MSTQRSKTLLALLSGGALLMAACSAREEAGLHVVIDGPLTPGTDFDRLSVISRLAETGTPLSLEVFEGDSLRQLPASLNLLSGPGTPSGTRVEVFATAELAGVVRSAVLGQGELLTGEGGKLALTLPPLPRPPGGDERVEVCSNGLDDDGDGSADCADSDCEARPCTQKGGLTCAANLCTCPGGSVGVYALREGFSALPSPLAALIPAGPRGGQVALASTPVSEVGFFDPGTGRLDLLSTVTPRAQPSLAALADGTVLVVGGAGESSLERLSPGGEAFERQAGEGTFNAEGASALGLGDSAVLAGGSLKVGNSPARTNRVLTMTAAGVHERLGEVSAACLQSMVRVSEDAVVIAGGCEGTPESGTAVAMATSLQSGPSLPVALAAPALAALPGGRVLVAGGTSTSGDPSDRAFLFERSGEGSSSIRELPAMPEALAHPVASGLSGGWVFLADRQSGRALWFDPAGERFVTASALPGVRTDFALVGLGTNAALLVGGEADGSPATSALIASPICP